MYEANGAVRFRHTADSIDEGRWVLRRDYPLVVAVLNFLQDGRLNSGGMLARKRFVSCPQFGSHAECLPEGIRDRCHCEAFVSRLADAPGDRLQVFLSSVMGTRLLSVC